MNTIKANILDVVTKNFFFGEIAFDSKVRRITKLNNKPNRNALIIAPGFIDAHVHIESTLCTPQRFAQMAAEHGTIAAVCDPHEITNVMGEEGFDYMVKYGQESCIKLFFAAPSCVPATSYETSGAKIGVEETKRALSKSVALAEMMNYPGVIYEDPEVIAKINLARKMGKPIDGHCPELKGQDLIKYIDSGISTDHECSTLEEAEEKIGYGMHILIREGSAARNYEKLKPLLTSCPEKTMLCTDDAHPHDICNRRYLERFFIAGLNDGISIYNLYQAALLNPIKHYQLSNVGRLQVGDPADFIVLDNFEEFFVLATFINGERVFCLGGEKDKETYEPEINKIVDSYHFSPSDFEIKVKSESANVIVCSNGQLLTKQEIIKISQPLGCDYTCENDVVKIAVINRYKESPISLALIKGTGLINGAFASSVAHDSHNVVVIGTNNEDMAAAAQIVFDNGGGLAATHKEEKHVLPLPYAGLMTNKYYRKVSEAYNEIKKFIKEKCSCTLDSPLMTVAFMSLLVIPEIKLSDKGLFDSANFKFINLFN